MWLQWLHGISCAPQSVCLTETMPIASYELHTAEKYLDVGVSSSASLFWLYDAHYICCEVVSGFGGLLLVRSPRIVTDPQHSISSQDDNLGIYYT